MPENSELNLRDYLRFSVAPQENASIRIAFGSEYKLFAISDGHCSCSLYSKPAEPEDETKLRVKYQKKGWSEKKICRAVADKMSSIQSGLHPDLRQQLAKLVANSNRSLLLVHFYAGDSDTETLEIQNKKEIFIRDLLNNTAIPETRLFI